MENSEIKNDIIVLQGAITKIAKVQQLGVSQQDEMADVVNIIASFTEELMGFKGVVMGEVDGIKSNIEKINKVIKTEEITGIQVGLIEKERRKRVTHILKGNRTDEYAVFSGAYFSAIGYDIKNYFKEGDVEVMAFKNIRKDQYEEVINYIHNWTPTNRVKNKAITDMLILRDKMEDCQIQINSGKLSKSKEMNYAIKIEKNEKKLNKFERYLAKGSKKNEI